MDNNYFLEVEMFSITFEIKLVLIKTVVHIGID